MWLTFPPINTFCLGAARMRGLLRGVEEDAALGIAPRRRRRQSIPRERDQEVELRSGLGQVWCQAETGTMT